MSLQRFYGSSVQTVVIRGDTPAIHFILFFFLLVSFDI